ncbi:MAG: helicase-associated domain-containing protein [Isosphaeraceae bacterium]
MARHVQIIAPANVSEAYERLGLDTLQPLAKLIAGDAPKRKSDLVPYLSRLMSQPEEIRRLYDSLGEVSKAAIQEALADPAGKLDLDRFIAKYGHRPDLGGYSSASRLQLFLPIDRSIPEDLRLILRDFVPEPREVTISSLVSFSRLNTEFAPPGRNGSARNSSTSSSGSRRSKASKARGSMRPRIGARRSAMCWRNVRSTVGSPSTSSSVFSKPAVRISPSRELSGSFTSRSTDTVISTIEDVTQPEQIVAKKTWKVLANHDVVSSEQNPDPADTLFLERVAERTSDRVWRLDRDKIVAAVEHGFGIDALREFLAERSSEPLPANVQTFLGDLRHRAGRLRDRGVARMIECADPETALILMADAKLKTICLLAGERNLVFPAAQESTIRSRLRKLGFVVPPSK